MLYSYQLSSNKRVATVSYPCKPLTPYPISGTEFLMNEIKKNYQTAMLYKYVCQTLSKNKACSKNLRK